MARTIEVIYNTMVAEKETMAALNVYLPLGDTYQTLLTDLKSPSRVAKWRLFFWVIATCANAVEIIFDVATTALKALVAKSRYGTIAWYIDAAKNFQYGDALTFVNGEWVYAVPDDTKKVIKFAAADDTVGIVNLKIATLNGDLPVPVITAIYDAFVVYINIIRPAGVAVDVINSVSDDVKLILNINYDPLVLTSTGDLISSPGVKPVDNALVNYIKNGRVFNGAYDRMQQVDYIEAAQGVVSAYITYAAARYGVNPFIPFDESYVPNAGHLVIHPDTVINYTAASV